MAKKHILKKEAYLKAIEKLANEEESEEKERHLKILLNDYYLHCYYHGLDSSFGRLIPLLDKAYIIPSNPEITNIPKDMVIPIVDNLKEGRAITEEQADIIIKYVVQNARNIIGKDCDIMTSSLLGKCGYGQALTIVPFEQIGVKATINNTFNFPNCNYLHAFGTVKLPIKSDTEYYNQYLIDVTYRQFYSSVTACFGRYFVPYMGTRAKNAPMHGYHMTKYPGGKEIASKVLKDGYIKLTPDILKAYGVCFELQTLPFDYLNKRDSILNTDPLMYVKSLDNQTELSYDYLDLMEIAHMTKLPSSVIKR